MAIQNVNGALESRLPTSNRNVQLRPQTEGTADGGQAVQAAPGSQNPPIGLQNRNDRQPAVIREQNGAAGVFGVNNGEEAEPAGQIEPAEPEREKPRTGSLEDIAGDLGGGNTNTGPAIANGPAEGLNRANTEGGRLPGPPTAPSGAVGQNASLQRAERAQVAAQNEINAVSAQRTAGVQAGNQNNANTAVPEAIGTRIDTFA